MSRKMWTARIRLVLSWIMMAAPGHPMINGRHGSPMSRSLPHVPYALILSERMNCFVFILEMEEIFTHTYSSTVCVSSVQGGKNTSTSVWVCVPGILGTLIFDVRSYKKSFEYFQVIGSRVSLLLLWKPFQ
jgi:hypothetical protein